MVRSIRLKPPHEPVFAILRQFLHSLNILNVYIFLKPIPPNRVLLFHDIQRRDNPLKPPSIAPSALKLCFDFLLQALILREPIEALSDGKKLLIKLILQS